MQNVADRAYQTLSVSKHQEAARWLAVSGADYAEAAVRKGRLDGQKSWEARFQQGRFRVEARPRGPGWEIVSVGHAGQASYELVREVRP